MSISDDEVLIVRPGEYVFSGVVPAERVHASLMDW